MRALNVIPGLLAALVGAAALSACAPDSGLPRGDQTSNDTAAVSGPGKGASDARIPELGGDPSVARDGIAHIRFPKAIRARGFREPFGDDAFGKIYGHIHSLRLVGIKIDDRRLHTHQRQVKSAAFVALRRERSENE